MDKKRYCDQCVVYLNKVNALSRDPISRTYVISDCDIATSSIDTQRSIDQRICKIHKAMIQAFFSHPAPVRVQN